MRLSPELQAYFDSWPKERDRRLRSLHRRILARVPGVAVSMRFRMPTYESGHGWMAIANQNEYLSVYTSRRANLRPYLKRHPATPAGRFCLHFSDIDPIDGDALDEVIALSLSAPARPRARTSARGSRRAVRTRKSANTASPRSRRRR